MLMAAATDDMKQQGLAQRVKAARNKKGQVICQRSDQVGRYLASIHQMAPPKRGRTRLVIALLLIYRPRIDERLSWPSWLTCSGRFTHISGHPSAAGEA